MNSPLGVNNTYETNAETSEDLKSSPDKKNKQRAFLQLLCKSFFHLTLIVVALYFISFTVKTYDDKPQVKGDAYGYVTMAYNLSMYGVLSKACEDYTKSCPRENLIPTYYREPFFSTLLALSLILDPKTRDLSRQDFYPTPGHLSHYAFFNMHVLQWITVFLAGAFGMAITWFITKNWIAAYLSAILICTSPVLGHYSQYFLTELTAAMLLTAASLATLLAISTKRLIYFGTLGILLGLLTLTKAVFYYSWPAVLLFLLLAWWWQKEDRKKIALGAGTFLCAYALIAGAWMARNYYHFDHFTISQRGGRALTIRTFFNQMTKDEWLASFLIWAPDKKAKELLKKHFEPSIISRFNRSNSEGFYRSARAFGANIIAEKGNSEGDSYLKDVAVKNIISNPIKHIAVSTSLAFRGMLIEKERNFLKLVKLQRIPMNLLLFASLFLVTLVGLFKRNTKILGFVLLAMFSFTFYSLFSNCRARYAMPTLPVLYASLVIIFYWITAGLYRSCRWICNRVAGTGSKQ